MFRKQDVVTPVPTPEPVVAEVAKPTAPKKKRPTRKKAAVKKPAKNA